MTGTAINIGIIGGGFVGNALGNGFIKSIPSDDVSLDIRCYDIDPAKSTHSYKETISCDYVFVCLPTPMGPTGACDLSIINKFFENISVPCDERDDGVVELDEDCQCDDVTVFIIKSTVPIGTTRVLCEKYPDLHIIHSPEFLTAANAEYDFIHTERNVLGGNEHLVNAVADLYDIFFPNTPTHLMSSDESEAVKYFSNVALTVKIGLFNELYGLCDELDIGWDTIIDAVTADSRIGESHTRVPGPDGEMGFGGDCFPKDLAALIDTMEKNGADSQILRATQRMNNKIRGIAKELGMHRLRAENTT